MAEETRLFTKTRLPTSWRQALSYATILSILLFTAIVPAEHIQWWFGFDRWRNHTLGSDTPISAAMLWLLAANATSFVAVLVLFLDLRHLEKMIRNHTFALDVARATARCRVSGEALTKAKSNPLAWAVAPLEWMYGISIVVMFATVILTALVVFHHPNVPSWVFTLLVLWTGCIYLVVMTLGDIQACQAYLRATCLKHQWPAPMTDEEKADWRRNFTEFLEALSDYERIFWYVDIPILLSIAVVLTHKFLVLREDSYFLGFVAGALAMHTVLANIISLAIALSLTTATVEPAE